MEPGTEPVADEELLYRRIPASKAVGWLSTKTGLNSEAFAPHKTNDATGLSIVRAKYKSVEEAAKGRPGKSYFVAVLHAADLKQNGIDVVPRPQPGDPGHAELPNLNSGNRKSDQSLELQRILAALTLKVEGPFGPG